MRFSLSFIPVAAAVAAEKGMVCACRLQHVAHTSPTPSAFQYAGGGDLWAFLQANSGHLSERTCVALVLQVSGR